MTMPKGESDGKGRAFVIELDSGDCLKKVSIPNGNQRILIEGTIGKLKRAEFVEDLVLELVGAGGVLRVDLAREDLAKRTEKGGSPK